MHMTSLAAGWLSSLRHFDCEAARVPCVGGNKEIRADKKVVPHSVRGCSKFLWCPHVDFKTDSTQLNSTHAEVDSTISVQRFENSPSKATP